MKKFCVAVVLTWAVVSAQPGRVACGAKDLAFTLDSGKGDFDGMSHSGTYLVLRNTGAAACSVAAFPRAEFLKGTKVLEAKAEVAGTRFMHPGPVVLPVVIAPGAEVTATLRWVDGPVYGESVCLEPTAIALSVGDAKKTAKLRARVCGDRAKGVTYEMTRFVLKRT